MKKYLLAATAFLLAAFAVSCDNEPKRPPVDPIDPVGQSIKFTTVSDAIYEGESKGEGTGYFYFTLSNDQGDKLLVRCFGAVAMNAANARFTTGEYKPGTMEAHTLKTFVTAESSSAEGTIYWKNEEAFPIDGGTMKVNSAGSNYTLSMDFTSGEKKIEARYEGTLRFKADIKVAPRDPEPNPRPVKEVMGQYMGKLKPDSDLALFAMRLIYKGESAGETIKNAEILQIVGVMPAADDNNNAYPAEGTYNVSSSTTPSAFMIVPGNADVQNGYTDTYEFYSDAEGYMTKGYIVSEGTVTIAKSGENYKITANLKGKRADGAGSIIGKELEDVVYEYEGPLEALDNSADAPTNLTEDLDLGTITHQGLLQTIPRAFDNDLTGWFYYLWDNGISGEITDKTLNIIGAGNMLIVAIIGPAQSTDAPVGEFPMGRMYGDLTTENSAWPGSPNLTSFQPDVMGCWYADALMETNTMRLRTYMGAVPNKGFVRTSNDGNIHTVEFEWYDQKGNKVSGKYEGEIEIVKKEEGSSTSGSSMMYVPAYTIACDYTTTILTNMIR